MKKRSTSLQELKGPHYRMTEGAIKLRAWFLDIVRKESFLEKVAKLRQKYDIPQNGFGNATLEDEKMWWEIYRKRREEFERDLGDLSQEYGIYCPHISVHPVAMFIAFGETKTIGGMEHAWDLCDFCDRTNKEDSHLAVSESRTHGQAFPIAVFISPYANKSDILDYINATYDTIIAPLQEKHKRPDVGIGKTRLKDPSHTEISDFIYHNQALPRERLVKLVNETFGAESAPGYAEIGKIISLENKRRK